MSLHSSTAVAIRRPRLGLIAGIAAAGLATGAATVVIADQQPAPQGNSAKPSQAATTPYFDIEANKAITMRALGRHIYQQRANRTSRYDDIEANKARTQGAR